MIDFGADITGLQGIDFAYDVKSRFENNVTSGHRFSITNLPTFLSFDTNTGILTGTPNQNGLFPTIEVRAVNISSNSITERVEFSLAVNGDPLRKYAWHLDNTGQKNFANRSGTSGVDIKLFDVFKEGITGVGAKIAISDSGVEVNHDDLIGNALSGEHRDYSLRSPYIGNPVSTNAHGTAVIGIASATGWNNKGSIGVAPGSKFAAFQFLDSSQSTSILLHQATGNFDIFNYSYGDTLYFPNFSDADYLDLLREQTLNQNKVYVKAAGNEHAQYSDDFRKCVSHNANFPFENESPHMIVVGAIDADGFKATYSNAGSNLWVVAPGGEFGENSAGGDPAIMTTDLPTCFRGFSKSGSSQTNTFEYNNSENINCNYTSTMNGTSSAVPVISGVIALLKEANPNLNMRDYKHILAKTSKQTDPTHSNIFGTDHLSRLSGSCDQMNLLGHDYELGWVTNAANYTFNNFYGFGLVDAKAAVNYAKNYDYTLGNQIELNKDFNLNIYSRTNLNLTIPNDSTSPFSQSINSTGVTDTRFISNDITVESVQVKVSITHPSPGEIGIELTSPSGTKSILQNINNSFLLGNTSNLNIVLTSNAFYGESSNGNWELKVIDGQTGSNSGQLNEWHINILGH